MLLCKSQNQKRNIMELLTLNEISKKILKDLSFTLCSGDTIVLVVGNSVGKTILMNAVLGLSSYQSGTLKSYTLNKSNDIDDLIENPGLCPFFTGFENMKLIQLS